jgi:hypothetical protein
MNEKSCVGCKFLFGDGNGYSDYTWMDTGVRCARERNPKLPVDEPYDWQMEPDNLPATMEGRCDLYSPGPYITISPDGNPNSDPIDDEQKQAIADARYVSEWEGKGT